MAAGIIDLCYDKCGGTDVPPHLFSPRNEGEDLFCKGDHDAAGNSEHAVGPLGGVVALEGQAQLEYAEAQQNQAHCPDQRKE